MISKLMAYELEFLENRFVVKKAKQLLKSGLIKEKELEGIQSHFHSPYYSPSIAIKILLFLAGVFGISTASGPIFLVLSTDSLIGFRVVSLIMGLVVFFLNDQLLVKQRFHYKSGITEAMSYISLAYIYFGILAFDANFYAYLCLGFIFCSFIFIRYLDLFALISSIVLFSWLLFSILYDLGGIIQQLIPIIFMLYSGIAYGIITWLEKRSTSEIFSMLFWLSKSLFLLLLYCSGNYFVVRELSVALMGLQLLPGENIPFYLLFYATTALIPLAYLGFGIKNKSMLLIRIGLLCFALSIVTLKMYFSLGMPITTITVAGALLIVVSLVLIRYLKHIRGVFSREKLFQHEWNSDDATAFIISQTAGGTPQNSDEKLFDGGKFGGGGAGSEY